MKKTLGILLLLSALNSCSSTGALSSFRASSSNSFVEGKDEFIELKDGTLVEGKIDNLDWRNNLPMIQSSKFSINGTAYRGKEINALQSKNRYFKRTVYNDFAERIIKGKINVYRLEKQTAPNANGRITGYSLYYLQKGETEPLNEYDNNLMEKTIGDNLAVLAKFNEYKKMSSKERNKHGGNYLTEIIELYNK